MRYIPFLFQPLLFFHTFTLFISLNYNGTMAAAAAMAFFQCLARNHNIFLQTTAGNCASEWVFSSVLSQGILYALFLVKKVWIERGHRR